MKKHVPIAKKIHLIGIGGIGMSALAFILAETGYRVSGSDIEENGIVKKLRRKGIDVNIGHDPSGANGRDLVVFSSSIRADNPELLQARKNRIKVVSRMELLKMVMAKYKRVIGVTGTHGKTTITAMAAHLLEEAGFDPTVLIGGESPHFDGNFKLGTSGTLIAEVDESDGRFVMLTELTHIIISNLEREHLEHYRGEEHLVDTFKNFLGSQKKRGTLFCNFDDHNLQKIKTSYNGRITGFGFSEFADVRTVALREGALKVDFDCSFGRDGMDRFTINIPGSHNASNALAVISLGLRLGINVETIKRSLAAYRGVKRRFEIIGTLNGARVVEDYAHHPTEVKATISAALSMRAKRLVTIFQPHRYTRTKSFYKEFASAFSGSNEVVLTDVYSASEEKIRGASSKRIYDIMAKDKTLPVKFVENAEIEKYLRRNTKKGDLVLVMGAGDIGRFMRAIISPGYQ